MTARLEELARPELIRALRDTCAGGHSVRVPETGVRRVAVCSIAAKGSRSLVALAAVVLVASVAAFVGTPYTAYADAGVGDA